LRSEGLHRLPWRSALVVLIILTILFAEFFRWPSPVPASQPRASQLVVSGSGGLSAPDFSVTANPSVIRVSEGSNVQVTLTLVPRNGFTGQTVLGFGVELFFPPPSSPGVSPSVLTLDTNGAMSGTVTINAGSTSPTGDYSLIVIASIPSNPYFHTFTFPIQVYYEPANFYDFNITATPDLLNLRQSGSTGKWPTQNSSITLFSFQGLNGPVQLVLVGLNFPNEYPGLTLAQTNLTLPANGFVKTVLSDANTSELGVLIRAISQGGITHWALVNTRSTPTGFDITTSGTILVSRGTSVTSHATLTSFYNFSAPLSLTASISPMAPGEVDVSVSPFTVTPPANGTVTIEVTVSASSSATLQTYTLTLTASNSWISRTASVQVHVLIHPYAAGITEGTWASYDISLSDFPDHSISSTITVTGVAGSNATFGIDIYVDGVLTNRTQESEDIFFGRFSNPIIPLFLVAANLGIGDSLYPGAFYSVAVGSQATTRVAGSLRLLNHANSNNISPSESGAWDKVTGLLVSLDAIIPANSTYVMAHYSLSATNAWAPLSLFLTPSPMHAQALEKVRFSFKVSGGIPPYNYHWNFGDGQESTEPNPDHSYLLPGSYQLTLRATDSAGDTQIATSTVMVSIPRSPAAFLNLFFLIPSFVTGLLLALSVYLPVTLIISLIFIQRERRRQHLLTQLAALNEPDKRS